MMTEAQNASMDAGTRAIIEEMEWLNKNDSGKQSVWLEFLPLCRTLYRICERDPELLPATLRQNILSVVLQKAQHFAIDTASHPYVAPLVNFLSEKTSVAT